MYKRLLTRLSLTAVVLGLTACATVSQDLSVISEQATSSSITNKVSLGSMIAVPPDGGIDSTQAKVVDEYFSASGRHCVRVEIKESGNSTRVICQREGGQWSFTRALFNDKMPTEREELLITTPLDGVESNPAQLPLTDHSSVADIFGTAFETHFTSLLSFDGDRVWNFAGTSTAGPAKWTQLALANVPALRDLVGFADNNEPITGRR